MNTPLRTVISASRRTDIPAFYMDWFMACLDRGFFEVINPYNNRRTYVAATPAQVHTIVFWSKDFGRFIAEGYGTELRRRAYHLFFNFTINSANTLLEPGVPALSQRLEQLVRLAHSFNPRTIFWRFDPICFYQNGATMQNNLGDFEEIAECAQRCGIQTCVTSFVDIYAKIRRRSNVSFAEPSSLAKLRVLAYMQTVLRGRDMQLRLCCEKDLMAMLPPDSGILNSSCIPNHLLQELSGGRVSLQVDRGQRRSLGCDCRKSVDIGNYRQHPCYHNCLFCYANPYTEPSA